MELSDLDDYKKLITQVNVSNELGPTRPIYRLDLDPEYVAYYSLLGLKLEIIETYKVDLIHDQAIYSFNRLKKSVRVVRNFTAYHHLD